MIRNNLFKLQVMILSFAIVLALVGMTVLLIHIVEAYALPPNTTDWNWGIVEGINSSSAYPDNYYNNGYPNELIDDDLEEDEEIADEKEHQIESEEYDR